MWMIEIDQVTMKKYQQQFLSTIEDIMDLVICWTFCYIFDCLDQIRMSQIHRKIKWHGIIIHFRKRNLLRKEIWRVIQIIFDVI